MKEVTYTSKTHGSYTVKISEEDFDRVVASGKWSIVKKRNSLMYFQKRIKGKIIELHRWLLDAPEGSYVDHINNNTLDNRRNNLRITTNGANLRNGRVRRNNTSGITGVRFRSERGKWEARIRVNYEIHVLGLFKEKSDAIKARKKAEREYFDV